MGLSLKRKRKKIKTYTTRQMEIRPSLLVLQKFRLEFEDILI